MATDPDLWEERWLSRPRLRKYLRAAGQNRDRALALYLWDADLAVALLGDIGHLEVGLRNAYDRALSLLPVLHGRDWLSHDGALAVFPKGLGPDGLRAAMSRLAIETAAKRAASEHNPPSHDQIITQLTLGFWHNLSADHNANHLWWPSLASAFDDRLDRRAFHGTLGSIRTMRNRCAHHGSVFDHDPVGTHRRVVSAATHISPELGQLVRERSRVPDLMRAKP